jgi:hypothetical protein
MYERMIFVTRIELESTRQLIRDNFPISKLHETTEADIDYFVSGYDSKRGEQALKDAGMSAYPVYPVNISGITPVVNVLEKEPEKDESKKEDRRMSCTLVTSRFKSLEGRVLTIVDASFTDKTQRDAVKTLVKKEFRLTLDGVYRYFVPGYSDDGDGDCSD